MIQGHWRWFGVQQRAWLVPQWRWMAILTASTMLLAVEQVLAPTNGRIPMGLAIQGVAAGLTCFLLLWTATRPQKPHWLAHMQADLPGWLRHPAWRLLAILWAAVMLYQIATSHFMAEAFRGAYRIDAIAYAHIDGDLVLQGHNPYTTDNVFWDAYHRWPQALSTPLMGGTFGNNPLIYPHDHRLNQVLFWESANPSTPTRDFDLATVHDYPAGIIWLELPLLLVGLPSIVWLNILAWALAIAIILRCAPRAARGPALFVLLLSPVGDRNLVSNFDIVSIVFVIAAWHWFARGRWSALSIGLACAVKQIAWFFLPFYFVDVYCREGWRGVVRRGGWAALGFLLPNLPFIILSPVDWFRSIWLPLIDPMFPIGVGSIALAFGGLVPILSAHLWTVAELAVFAALLYLQYRRRGSMPDGLLLALVPLWFAWRSPLNYFAWMPLLATYVVTYRLAMQQRVTAAPRPVAAESSLPLESEPVAPESLAIP